MEDRTNEVVEFRSRLFEVRSFDAPSPNMDRFEMVFRAPGVRVLLEEDGMFLMSSEVRHELGAADLRLPGGKVFDDISEGYRFWDLDAADQAFAVEAAARRELREELGITTGELTLLEVVPLGATVSWDLHFLLGHGWTPVATGTEHEPGEESIQPVVLTAAELWDAVHTGVVSEGRSALVVSKYLHTALKE